MNLSLNVFSNESTLFSKESILALIAFTSPVISLNFGKSSFSIHDGIFSTILYFI
jgi:hypothetical protein